MFLAISWIVSADIIFSEYSRSCCTACINVYAMITVQFYFCHVTKFGRPKTHSYADAFLCGQTHAWKVVINQRMSTVNHQISLNS